MSEQRKIRVTKIKWNRTSPEISNEESLDNATKTIGGMQAKGIIPHVDFIQAVEDLKADFLAMMELNLRVGDLNLDDALAQASRDAGKTTGNIPAVFHRKNGTGWKVTMGANDWFRLYREWEAGGKP